MVAIMTQYSNDGVLASKDGISPYSSMLGVLPNVTHQAVLLASQVGGTFCLQKEGKKKQKKKKKRKSGNKAFFDDERRRRGLILRVTTEMEHKKSADAVAGANITAKLRKKVTWRC